MFCKGLMMRWLCSVFSFRFWGVEKEVFSSGDDGVERWERRCLGWWLKIFAVSFPGWKFDDWLSTFMDCVVCWLLDRRWLIFHVLLLGCIIYIRCMLFFWSCVVNNYKNIDSYKIFSLCFLVCGCFLFYLCIRFRVIF